MVHCECKHNVCSNLASVERRVESSKFHRSVAVEETVKHSYRSLAEAAGFEAREVDGVRGYYRNGQKVTEVTVDDIEISPIGAMINYSLDKGDISKEDAKRQKEDHGERRVRN